MTYVTFVLLILQPASQGAQVTEKCTNATGGCGQGQDQATQGQGTQGADIQVTQVTPAPSGCGCGRATETHSGTSMRPGFFYGGRVISTREGDRMATQQAKALEMSQ